ncbi:YhgE/Pip domain-containing protein [Ureibacillus aquaedulcis]|uniref:YhgE/Pip domain-containing protein n=1 Tax=Ureibacillus aquaedulcis TaxID=3058421 RepID=A0ABT8GPH1_9BACL|nr:YhgE/Pip domain-containing protein [Ureibacillus sp. BA0131]MDN4492806.1 YhgE/Pip domain-containing protein [Ureibacillus sp. BA0131]
MLKQEWKNIYKNPFLIVVILAIILVPMLYSLVFLSAYWDPYSKTDHLPIAVINNDNGAELDGKTLNIGNDFVDGLKENDKFDWKFTTKEKAMEGLNNEDYYMVIEIPSDFSENASTLLDENPQKMKLSYYTNPGKNYSGSQISASAIKEINTSISKEVTEQYADTVFKSFKEVGNGMQDASDGAKKVNDGVNQLANGTTTLNENLKKLKESTLDFKNGAATLQSGTVAVANGIKQSSDGANELNTGIETVSDGANSLRTGASDLHTGLQGLSEAGKELEDGFNQLSNGNNQLAIGLKESVDGTMELQDNIVQYTNSISSVNSSIQNVTNEISALSKSESTSQEDLQKVLVQLQTIAQSMDQLNQGGQQIHTNYSQLAEGQNKLYTASGSLINGQNEFSSNFALFNSKLGEAEAGSQNLTQGSNDLVNGLEKISDGSSALAAGLEQLNSGGNELVDGVQQLNNGSDQLYNGSEKLAAGSDELVTGTNDLSDGTSELQHSLKDGADEINDLNTNEETNSMFASPVNLVAHKIDDVKDYGEGLAPYILAIGLLSGGLMFTSSYPMRTTLENPTSGFSYFISKYSVLLVVGVFQAIFADTILIYGLGLDVQSEFSFYVFTIFTSLTLYTIIQFLTVALDKTGQYLIFILLLLQIGGSAGTFPKVLTPAFFQDINPYLPLTYAINGFRELMSNTIDYEYLLHQALILSVFGVVFIILTNLYLTFTVKKQLNTNKEIVN